MRTQATPQRVTAQRDRVPPWAVGLEATSCLRWLRRHPAMGVSAHSQLADDSVSKAEHVLRALRLGKRPLHERDVVGAVALIRRGSVEDALGVQQNIGNAVGAGCIDDEL